ncbi:two pore calcium channel protein 1-like [Acanthaster planci]|uniref:Two pore calcium channel protein 1-like n=1 Tax=Acanthaster planci TaxID=133434 RepID=A0A8B7YYA6_ACAPL|nr:two pore calcium channel protein 1-like [Acanthaster planci]
MADTDMTDADIGENAINLSRNNISSTMDDLTSPLMNDPDGFETRTMNGFPDGLSVNTDDTTDDNTPGVRWELNYQEAAIYLREGENNHNFSTHPKSQDALPAYILVHNIWFYMMDFAAAVLLLGLALCERPAVQVFELPVFIHGSVELFLLTIIAIGLGLKGRWLGVKQFFLHKRTAFKTLVLLVMYCEAITVLARQQSHFRITRALRPFFLIDCHYCGGVRRVLRQIFQSLLPILDVMLLLFYFMVIFSILGFFIFSNVDRGNFDSLVDSFVSLFILMTTANFPDVMMPAYNNTPWSVLFFVVFLILELYFFMNLLLAVVYDTFTGIEKDKFKALHLHKRTGASKAFKLLCSRRHPGKVSFNHFEGLMKYYRPRFSKRNVMLAFKTLDASDTQLLTLSEFQEIYEVVQLRWHLRRDEGRLWYEDLAYPLHKPFEILNRFVNWSIFNYAIYLVLFVNGIVFIYKTIVLSSMNDVSKINTVNIAVDWYDWAFIGIYCGEILLKVVGLGFRGYFSSGWNVFDFAVTAIALLGMTVESVSSAFYFVILRPIRLLRLFKIKKRYRDVFGTFYVLLGRMLSVGIVIIVMYYFYAIIGMELFSDVALKNCCKNTSYESFFSEEGKFFFYLNNFGNILYSYVTLFELTVVNNWHVIMFGIAHTTTEWSRIYFILFYLSSLVVVTIIVTFILEAFVFRMQYGQRNSQADEEFVSSITSEMTLSLQELDRFYPPESRNSVPLAVLHTMLRNAPGRILTYKGSRKRTKADLSKTMYADEIKEWVRQQDQTQRQDLHQFLVRQLSRGGSHMLLSPTPADTPSSDDEPNHGNQDTTAFQQLQTFANEGTANHFDEELTCWPSRTDQPYWEVPQQDSPFLRREPDQPSMVWSRDIDNLQEKSSCQFRNVGMEYDDDDELIKA